MRAGGAPGARLPDAWSCQRRDGDGTRAGDESTPGAGLSGVQGALGECYSVFGAATMAEHAAASADALTGSADVAQWWGGVLGPGKAIDTNKYSWSPAGVGTYGQMMAINDGTVITGEF